jgi:hypothetical protein
MEIDDEKIRNAVLSTEILRTPKQSLYTFGITTISYYLITQPVYSDPEAQANETVIREGKVIANRPRIVTPYYLSKLEGFGAEARKYFEALAAEFGASVAGIYYTYKNEPKEMNIVSDSLRSVVEKINAKIDERGDNLAAIIKGEDTLWDVSLLKFIFELTRRSVGDNINQMGQRGLLNMDSSGLPADARMRIEDMFQRVSRGESEPRELKDELDRWHVFEEYQDRFLALFGKMG